MTAKASCTLLTNKSVNLTLRSTVEPIKQFRIELTANKTTSNNNNEYFRWDNQNNAFTSFSPTESGSYSVSFISFRTTFLGDNDDHSSEVFSTFRNYRASIAYKLAMVASNKADMVASLKPKNDYKDSQFIEWGRCSTISD